MVIFIGDKPSRKNLNPNIPFVGTQSYKKLLEWIWYLDVDINSVKVTNSDNWDRDSLLGSYMFGHKIVILGNNAEKKILQKLSQLTSLNQPIDYFKLPHPSGLNRKLNDKKWLQKELNKCKKYLHG